MRKLRCHFIGGQYQTGNVDRGAILKNNFCSGQPVITSGPAILNQSQNIFLVISGGRVYFTIKEFCISPGKVKDLISGFPVVVDGQSHDENTGDQKNQAERGKNNKRWYWNERCLSYARQNGRDRIHRTATDGQNAVSGYEVAPSHGIVKILCCKMSLVIGESRLAFEAREVQAMVKKGLYERVGF